MKDRDITKEEMDTILYNIGKRIDCIDDKESMFGIKYFSRSRNNKYDEREAYLELFLNVYTYFYDNKEQVITYSRAQNEVDQIAENLKFENRLCFSYSTGIFHATAIIKSIIHGVKSL